MMDNTVTQRLGQLEAAPTVVEANLTLAIYSAESSSRHG
jgi:hypothetical protein